MIEVLNAVEAAEHLKLSPRTVVKYASLGQLPGKKIGSLWRFRRDVLDEWLKSDVDSSRRPQPETEAK